MCEAFERWTKEIEEKNLMIGERRGKMRGEIKGERKIFINLVEMKLGKLSEELKEQLNNCSDRVFGHLIERFYQLNDEKEIRQILLS